MNNTITATAVPMRLKLNDLPLPDDVKQRTAILQRLRGHVVSTAWLPEGLAPELDATRTEHVRRIAQAVEAADHLRRLEERWAQQDAAHAAALRDAAREGAGAPADKRTADADRQTEEKSAAERLHATLMVLVEAVGAAVEVIREHEAEWLSVLRDGAGQAKEDRREAERLVEQARRHEFCQHRLASWLLAAANDDDGFSQQPSPTGQEAPPSTFHGLDPAAFERPWFRGQPWNPGTGAAPEPVAVPSTRGVHTVVRSDRDRGGRRA